MVLQPVPTEFDSESQNTAIVVTDWVWRMWICGNRQGAESLPLRLLRFPEISDELSDWKDMNTTLRSEIDRINVELQWSPHKWSINMDIPALIVHGCIPTFLPLLFYLGFIALSLCQIITHTRLMLWPLVCCAHLPLFRNTFRLVIFASVNPLPKNAISLILVLFLCFY